MDVNTVNTDQLAAEKQRIERLLFSIVVTKHDTDAEHPGHGDDRCEHGIITEPNSPSCTFCRNAIDSPQQLLERYREICEALGLVTD